MHLECATLQQVFAMISIADVDTKSFTPPYHSAADRRQEPRHARNEQIILHELLHFLSVFVIVVLE
jgi:hypothetical protein